MKRVLITGANGQLGQELRELLHNNTDFKVLYADRSILDIANTSAVNLFFQTHRFDFVINCAAYTAVDKAENDLQSCFSINENGPKNLAIACRGQNTFLIHISTDFVFSGDISYPLTETSPVAPKSIYGTSKLAGERMVKTFTDNHIIIRTAWLYSTFGNNFTKTILRLGKEREWLKVVFDQIGSPTYARDLAEAIIDIMYDQDIRLKTGVYHYSNEGVASWYDFALAIMEFAGLKTTIFPIETQEYPTPAKRPHFSVLNKGKIKGAFGIRIPHWRDSLKECVERIKNEELKMKN